MANRDKPRQAVASRGEAWEKTGASRGEPWQAVVRRGKIPVQASRGKPWQTVAGRGKPWQAQQSKPWQAKPWQTVASINSGKPWQSMMANRGKDSVVACHGHGTAAVLSRLAIKKSVWPGNNEEILSENII